MKTLYVEDDPEDVELVRLAISRCNANFDLHVIEDGEAAWIYFDSVSKGESARPDLILLDLNLPKRDGFSLLECLKSGPLRCTPVMILSNSSSESDVNRAYASGASLYFEKPTAIGDLCGLVDVMHRLWTDFAELPRLVALP